MMATDTRPTAEWLASIARRQTRLFAAEAVIDVGLSEMERWAAGMEPIIVALEAYPQTPNAPTREKVDAL